MSRDTLLWTLVFAFAGCSAAAPEQAPDDDDDVSSSAGDGAEDSASAGSTTIAGSTSAGDGSTDGGDASDGETGPNNVPPPATGIEIVHVTADQGVRVPIAYDGELVTERSIGILRDRPALIRAFYVVDEGFETRSILGELHVTTPDGTQTVYDSFTNAADIECEGGDLVECRYSAIGRTFAWRIPPEVVVPGTEYRIQLLETSPGHENDVSPKIPNFPTDGTTLPIGVEDSYMKMRVVLVPVEHTVAGDCEPPPDLDEVVAEDFDGNPLDVAEFFANRLAAANPVDEVEVIKHEPVGWGGSLQNGSLLSGLQQLRYDEGAPPEYYYYAVARPCGGGPDFSGIAQIGGPYKSEESSRVGWGVFHNSVSTTADTFVHEIGHEQGRHHIACNGEEGGPDPSYPDHPDGNLLSFGTDVFRTPIKVHTPSSHDYMTYCSNTWVSEWGWKKVTPWIHDISSWELEDVGHDDGREQLLIGTVREDGAQTWFVARGYFPAHRASKTVHARVTRSDGLSKTMEIADALWRESNDHNIIIRLTDAWKDVRAVDLEGFEHPLAVDLARVSVVP